MNQEEAKKVVLSFLEKTIAYAEKHIEKIKDLSQYPEEEQILRQKRLEAWQSYVEFQKHTIKEIQAGKLDDWFK